MSLDTKPTYDGLDRDLHQTAGLNIQERISRHIWSPRRIGGLALPSSTSASRSSSSGNGQSAPSCGNFTNAATAPRPMTPGDWPNRR
jgi:hypothetical protein